MSRQAGHLEVHEVDENRWPDFERLFESRGGPKWCWCMVFRMDESGKKPRDRAGLKRAMRRKVETGVRVGLLAYLDGEPVAWCSTAPRSTFVNLNALEPEGEDPGTVWSISCFYVRSSLRRRGIMGTLIEEAVRCARDNGASVIEAYPVDPESPSYRFCGYVPVFETHGFREVGRAGLRRHVMRRDV